MNSKLKFAINDLLQEKCCHQSAAFLGFSFIYKRRKIMASVIGKQSNTKKMASSHKFISVVLLLGSMLLGIEFKAVAQLRPVPNRPIDSTIDRFKLMANLQVTAQRQGNCAPFTFVVSNTGGSSSGAFKINVLSDRGEIVQTFSVADLKAKESRTFEYRERLGGLYTIVVDPDNTVNELSKKDNKIQVEVYCIK